MCDTSRGIGLAVTQWCQCLLTNRPVRCVAGSRCQSIAWKRNAVNALRCFHSASDRRAMLVSSLTVDVGPNRGRVTYCVVTRAAMECRGHMRQGLNGSTSLQYFYRFWRAHDPECNLPNTTTHSCISSSHTAVAHCVASVALDHPIICFSRCAVPSFTVCSWLLVIATRSIRVANTRPVTRLTPLSHPPA